MRRSLIFLLAAVLTAVTGAGCVVVSRESGEGVPDALPEPPPASVTVTTESLPEGRFYVLLGKGDVFDYELYELDLASGSVTGVTDVSRVSSVAACPERVVVAAAQEEVGFSDHIQEVRGTELAPLTGLGLTEGFTPALDADCRLAYGWPDRSVDPTVGELRVWQPDDGEPITLYRTQPGDGVIIHAAWGPGGQVAAVRTEPDDPDGDGPQVATGRPAAIIVARPDGSVDELNPGLGRLGILTWGATWMAISDEPQRATVFLNHATGERKVLPGWVPIDWSPDRRTLLVHDFTTERRLGLVDESDLTTVHEIAVLNRAIGGGVWLAA